MSQPENLKTQVSNLQSTITDYTLLRPIGKGGYGQVWLARTLTGEHRALKIVHRQNFDEDRHCQREFRGIQAYSPTPTPTSTTQNLIHRDLKPSNILYLEGQPHLADPGLVTEIDRETSLVGTLGYLPPEGPGHPSADCFALGKILYELSTGQPPAAFPRLPEIARTENWPREARCLNQVIQTTCATDPAARYETATHLAEDLTRVPTPRPLHAARTRRHQKLALAAALILTITTLWITFAKNSTPAKSQTPKQTQTIPQPPPRMPPMQFHLPRASSTSAPEPPAPAGIETMHWALYKPHLPKPPPKMKIRLAAGFYEPSETLTLPSGVRLQSGFSPNGSEQDWKIHHSIISAHRKAGSQQIRP